PNDELPRKETLEEKRERVLNQLKGNSVASNSTSDQSNSSGNTLSLTYTPSTLNSSSSMFSTNATPGLTGLNNLGNTCFMNSALQCLSNCPKLTSHFLSSKWEIDLNRENPLGMEGRVAEAYANLIKNLWAQQEYKKHSYAPRHFKQTIGAFNSMFSGYSQQDSEELLRFLLDGLHEDLNRIRDKPYVATPEMDGKPDAEIAAVLWALYKLRNDSVIVDLFQGEYKSRVECIDCKKFSVTFDPYMFLSVPVPEKRKVTVAYTLVRKVGIQDSKEEVRFKLDVVELKKDATIDQLKSAVAERYGLQKANKENKLQVVEVYFSKVYKVYEAHTRVTEIRTNDIIYVVELNTPDFDLFAFDHSDPEFNQNEHAVHIPVYFTTPDSSTHYRSTGSLFGVPMIVSLPKLITATLPPSESIGSSEFLSAKMEKITGEKIYRQVVRELKRFSRIPLFRRKGTNTVLLDISTFIETHKGEIKDTHIGDSFPFDLSENDLGEEWEPIPDLFRLKLIRGNNEPPRAYSYVNPIEQFWKSGYERGSINLLYPREIREPQNNVEKSEKPSLLPGKFSRFPHLNESNDDTLDSFSNYSFPLESGSVSDDSTRDHISEKASVMNRYFNQDDVSSYDEIDIDTELKEEENQERKKTKMEFEEDWTHVTENGADGAPVIEFSAAEDGEKTDDAEILDNLIDEELAAPTPSSDLYGTSEEVRSLPESNGSTSRQSMSLDLTGENLLMIEFDPTIAELILGEDSVAKRYLQDSKGEFEGVKTKEYEALNNREAANVPTISLMECINEYCKEEILGEEDTWYCSNCKEHKRIKKKLDIWSVPEVLVFHLKRFSSTGRFSAFSRMLGDKIDCLIDFPIEGLDMTEKVIGSRQRMAVHIEGGKVESVTQEESKIEEGDGRLLYDLFAVSNHFGGLGGGHYTAYAKNAVDGEWYNFDDSHVSKISPDRVMTEAAYLLFYQRRNSTNTDILKTSLEESLTAGKPQSPLLPSRMKSNGKSVKGGRILSSGLESTSITATNTPKHSGGVSPVSDVDENDPPALTLPSVSPTEDKPVGNGIVRVTGVMDSLPAVDWGSALKNDASEDYEMVETSPPPYELDSRVPTKKEDVEMINPDTEIPDILSPRSDDAELLH
ncbi:CSN-associated deubiquitinating enzyme Ubp12, partial [Nowakowskiella sp. JEL0407]